MDIKLILLKIINNTPDNNNNEFGVFKLNIFKSGLVILVTP